MSDARRLRFNATSDRRDEFDGSPCYFEVDDGNTRKRLSRRQLRAMGFTVSEIDDATANKPAWIRCPTRKGAL